MNPILSQEITERTKGSDINAPPNQFNAEDAEDAEARRVRDMIPNSAPQRPPRLNGLGLIPLFVASVTSCEMPWLVSDL